MATNQTKLLDSWEGPSGKRNVQKSPKGVAKEQGQNLNEKQALIRKLQKKDFINI